jgi:pentatricopeptide repeat protein
MICLTKIVPICCLLVNAFGQNGMGSRAIDLYNRITLQMRNNIIHLCVLNACSHSGLLNEARSIFNEISPKTEKITTAMVGHFYLPIC